MRTLRLRDGRSIPVIGQGTWEMGGRSAAAAAEIAALKLGLDLGMTLIDTAEMYGSGAAEELVGRAIEGRRDELFLVSKVLPSNASRAGTLRACERSLARLRTDRIDLYLLHWESEQHPLEETLAAFVELERAGAIAGSTLPLDREMVAELLGFVDGKNQPRVTQNSMDAVSDRDFLIEFNAAAALIAVHLSRLAEDVILWASAEFNFIKIADAFTTGSSLMPQKKNPDVAELTRGKSARVIGNLMALLALLKGLPMTYNRDLQEDKERVFDTADTVRACVRLMTGMLLHTGVNEAVCAAAAGDPLLLATDLADLLVKEGVPFREAHHTVGAIVAHTEKIGRRLDQLTLAEFRKFDRRFPAEVTDIFRLDSAMERRALTGAPGAKQVRQQIARWKKSLA